MSFEKPPQQDLKTDSKKSFEEMEKEVRSISQMIGLDFSMKVRLGAPGKGSYYNSEENSITIDPISKNIEFVAAHEGAHRAITKFLKTLKVPRKEEKKKQEMLKNQEKVGWHFVFNSLEDVAVNDWVCKKFPRFDDLSKDQYLDIDQSIKEHIKKHGGMPRFMRYGFEAINQRYNGEVFKEDVPEEIKTALRNTKFMREDLYSKIPFVLDEKEVSSNSWARYKRNDFIWEKEIKKLAEEDQKDEEVKEFLKSRLDEDNDLSEEERKELEESIKKLKKELEEYLKEKFEKGELTSEELKRELNENCPIDLDDIGEELKEKLRKALEDSPKEIKEEIKKQAKKNLEDTEDKFNEKLTTKQKAEENSHEKRRTEEQRQEAQKKEQRRWEKIKQELKDKHLENEWERQRVLVLGEIDKLYSLIEKLFKPTKFAWKKGYESGHKLDLKAAMQSETRPILNLWEQKYLPQKKDYKFSILIDQSQSMAGKNIKNSFLGTIIFAETLSKLKIPYEVLGFSDRFINHTKTYKEFNENIKNKREHLSQIIKSTDGWTPTFEATRIASQRLAKTKRPSKNKAHFLLVVTDGKPDCSLQVLKQLNQELERKHNQVIIGLGIGNEIEEANLKEAYGKGRYIYCAEQAEFPSKMAELLKEIFEQTQGIR